MCARVCGEALPSAVPPLAAMALAIREQDKPQMPGDWLCPGCKDNQFARNPTCRKCGHNRPSDVSAAVAAAAPKLLLAGDWACPLCQCLCFGNRRNCPKCNTPRPEGGEAAQKALAALQAMPGSAATGAIVGYVAPGSVQPVSSWARQWTSGPENGMLVGETDLPDWLKGVSSSPPRTYGNATGSDDGAEKKKSKKKSKKTDAGGSDADLDAKKKKKKKGKKKNKDGSDDSDEEKLPATAMSAAASSMATTTAALSETRAIEERAPSQCAMTCTRREEGDLEAQEIKKAAAAPKDALGDREPIWDNLKGICVLLVVLIHTLRVFEQEVVAEGHFASGLILPLLFVCMPAFCFASGHLSKVADTRGRLVALFRMWAVFLIQQTLYAYFWALQSQYFQATSPVAFPFWKQFLPGVTWFLLCLAVWRTALPLLNLLRWPFLTALVLTMLAQSTDVAQSEYIKPMLSFLPFYLAGYRCPKGFLSAFPRSRDFAKCTFLSILMLSPALSLVLPSLESGVGLFDRMSRPTWTAYGCLYGGRIADSLEQGGPMCHSGAGLAVTLAFYAAALPLVFCFLACVPRR